jgi:hypothetical protein
MAYSAFFGDDFVEQKCMEPAWNMALKGRRGARETRNSFHSFSTSFQAVFP